MGALQRKRYSPGSVGGPEQPAITPESITANIFNHLRIIYSPDSILSYM